ncbi:MAG: phosphoenolpyruvate carboxykinase (GTP) [Candidatus Dadabacteria bacterium]|nr:MAG: phosphoenolpyruvate carboxykinase (GTP) [Candidatus Dadabacteria bacterium]
MNCSNTHVNSWVKECAERLCASEVVWFDGSSEEYRRICAELVDEGTFVPLNSEKFPNCYWSRSNPNDVARVEDRTFICSSSPDDAGPTNNWANPDEMYARLWEIMDGSMRGKKLYVIPYLMGPDGSPYSKVGFELTDSLYVAANMHIMARVGNVALKNLGDQSSDFVRGVHATCDLDPEKRYIAHFPDDRTIISVNSNYGGNALQGKKCFALRIASVQARNEGWMAEHMLIVGVTTPAGKKHYLCAAFPSACGKTNLAMLIPPKKYLDAGWKVEVVGDDIAWLNFGKDGRLYAINPEAGFFGVAPGTSYKTNPNAMESLKSDSIFTNTAFNPADKTPWWEGMSEPPAKLIDWLGEEWSPGCGRKAAHPNSRFTAPAKNCPAIDPDWESPNGVPVSAIIFGGRRAKAAPLVYQAFNWQHGTYVGVSMASETTAAAAGEVGKLRRDPMAMRPFIGYHAGDYFRHWLEMGRKGGDKMPAVFHVNWFRTDANGNFMWPGYGDNIRVLEWIIGRVEGKLDASECALGYQPRPEDINIDGLEIDRETIASLLEVRAEDWHTDLESQQEFFNEVGEKLPAEIKEEYQALKNRLGIS